MAYGYGMPSFGAGYGGYGGAQPGAIPDFPEGRPFARPAPYGHPLGQPGFGGMPGKMPQPVMGGGGDPRFKMGGGVGGGSYSPFQPQPAAFQALQRRQQLGAAQAMAPAAPYSPWANRIPPDWLPRAQQGFSRPGGRPPQAPPTRFAPQMAGGLMRGLTRAF